MRSLLDTNILVYADAADEPTRRRRAIDVITRHRMAGTAVLSIQVLQEYVNVALRKLKLPAPMVRERLAFYRRFEMIQTTPDLIDGAIDLHLLHGLSFYDALIVQAAVAGSCQRVLSEDMQHGARLGAVQIVNPFLDQGA